MLLDPEDGLLCGSRGLRLRTAGKPTGKEQRSGLGNHDHPVSDLPPEQIRGGGLATARASSEDDAATPALMRSQSILQAEPRGLAHEQTGREAGGFGGFHE